MKYRAYETFIDYLFSADAKEHPYDDLKAYLTASGNYSSFNPRETTFFPISSLSGAFVPSSKFTYPAARMDARPAVSNSNGLYNETDKSYEEVFNIPLKTNIDECPYINAFVQKAVWDAMLDPSYVIPTEQSTLEKLDDTIPFKSNFDETEYDSYGVEQNYLNGDVPGVVAQDITYSGSSLSLASGCLLGVEKNDKFYPIGFIDFESVVPCTSYQVKFDPQGFLQLSQS